MLEITFISYQFTFFFSRSCCYPITKGMESVQYKKKVEQKEA